MVKGDDRVARQKARSTPNARRVGSVCSPSDFTMYSDTMSAWLMEVLAMSDLETPLKPGDATEDAQKGLRCGHLPSNTTNKIIMRTTYNNNRVQVLQERETPGSLTGRKKRM